jgi:hypothetical protein
VGPHAGYCANSDPDPDPDANSDPNANSDPDTNPYAYTNPYADANTDSHSDARCCPWPAWTAGHFMKAA